MIRLRVAGDIKYEIPAGFSTTRTSHPRSRNWTNWWTCCSKKRWRWPSRASARIGNRQRAAQSETGIRHPFITRLLRREEKRDPASPADIRRQRRRERRGAAQMSCNRRQTAYGAALSRPRRVRYTLKHCCPAAVFDLECPGHSYGYQMPNRQPRRPCRPRKT